MIETVRTWRLLRELRALAAAPPEQLERARSALLREAVRHAESSPLYRRLWGDAGFDPGRVRGLSDLPRVPLLPASELRSGLETGEILAAGAEASELPSFPSSGSNGRPLLMPRGPGEQRAWRAGALSIWLEHGYSWRWRAAQLDPTAGPPHRLQRIGVSRTDWISPGLPLREQARRLAEARADVVAGTPTVLRRVVRAAADAGVELPPARLAFVQGELPDAATSRLVQGALGCEPVALYGLTEAGFAGWQCELRSGYHEPAGLCIVEVLRGDRAASAGETGRVVVTSLRWRTVPLIRYETGDLAVAGDGSCPCGRPLLTLASIEGRERDRIRLPDGGWLTTRRVVEALAPETTPDEYRLTQEPDGALRLELGSSAPADAEARVRALIGDAELEVVRGMSGADGGLKSQPVAGSPEAAPRARR